MYCRVFTLKLGFSKIAKKAKQFLRKIPFVNQIYTTISQIINIVESDKSNYLSKGSSCRVS